MDDSTKLFRVKMKDVGQAAINAILAAVVIGFYGLVSQEGGLDLFNTDWAVIVKQVINWSFAAFIGSVGKDFLTTSKGNLLGAVKIR